MSRREFYLATRRCLFHRYYDGTQVRDYLPRYSNFGESQCAHRFIMNDENGEDFVGKMKTSGSFSASELHRRSKLFNSFQNILSRKARQGTDRRRSYRRT